MTNKKRRPSSSTPAPALMPALGHATIAERAYHRWLARGCPIGDGREDWFAAQAELASEVGPTSKTRMAKALSRRSRANTKPQTATELVARVFPLYDSN